MSDAREPDLIDALAILASGLTNLGYPSKAAHGVMFAARNVVERHAKIAMERITGGLCTTCWGDGFHRTSTFVLSGACHDCAGSGRRAPISPSEASACKLEDDRARDEP